MNTMQTLEKLEKKAVKIDITKLKREHLAPEIRAKYFRHDNRDLNRLHLPAMTAEVYNPIANEEFTNVKDKANLKFETASGYYIRKAQIYVLAYDLGVSPKLLDSSNYIWNEDYYIHSNFLINLHIAEDLFREREVDQREASAYTVYISQDAKNTTTDVELWNELYNFCYTAIITKKAMLLQKVQQCLSFLVSILEYSCGFTENITSAQSAGMRSYKQFFTELLANKDALAFIKGTNDIEIFAKNDATHKDYVETYRSLIRSVSGCTGEEIVKYKSELMYVYDEYLDELTAKELDAEDILSGAYLNNESSED